MSLLDRLIQSILLGLLAIILLLGIEMRRDIKGVERRQDTLQSAISDLSKIMTDRIAEESNEQCLLGRAGFSVSLPNGDGVNVQWVGEQIVCARDWRWTHIYGPDIKTFLETVPLVPIPPQDQEPFN